MGATETSYRVRSLPQEAREAGDDKTLIHLGRALDTGAFGAGAAFQRKAGEAEMAQKDDDFASLREDPRFLQLMA
jgi:hypothetical protein